MCARSRPIRNPRTSFTPILFSPLHRLGNSSVIEAADIIEKLCLRDDKNLKLALFSLQKFIKVSGTRKSRSLTDLNSTKEEQFAQEFLKRGGLRELIVVIHSSHGNTLAVPQSGSYLRSQLTFLVQYALVAMQHLMELDYGWPDLDTEFIFRVVQILSSAQSLINVCRPATAILKKLVEADPRNATGPIIAGSSRSVPRPPPGSVYVYGFAVVFDQMRKDSRLLETVVNRLGSADTALTLYRFASRFLVRRDDL